MYNLYPVKFHLRLTRRLAILINGICVSVINEWLGRLELIKKIISLSLSLSLSISDWQPAAYHSPGCWPSERDAVGNLWTVRKTALVVLCFPCRSRSCIALLFIASGPLLRHLFYHPIRSCWHLSLHDKIVMRASASRRKTPAQECKDVSVLIHNWRVAFSLPTNLATTCVWLE